ncbi:MAG: capsular polysaccharide synthesis protein [Sphingobacterium sp.]
MEKITVQTLWIDNVLGDHQKLCLESFVKNDVEVILYTYVRVDNIPDNIIVKDANEILDQSFVFHDLYDSYATFSDWFRIKLLFDKGGWWIDADMLCIRPFDIDWPYVFATEIERVSDKEEVTHICNCVLKMPQGSDIGRSILRRIEETLSTNSPKDLPWTSIGAKFIATELTNRKMFDYVVAPEVFCPFDYSSYQNIFGEAEVELSETTYGVHLWNKMWEWSNRDPIKVMSKDSFFSKYIKST